MFSWIFQKYLIAFLMFANSENCSKMKHIYFNLKNIRQSLCLNNNYSYFRTIISRDPQGSIVGHFVFNPFLNDSFFCLKQTSVHNFSDNMTLSSFAKTFAELTIILTSESNNAMLVLWKMVINWNRFNSVVVQKNQVLKYKKVHTNSSAKLLAITQ